MSEIGTLVRFGVLVALVLCSTSCRPKGVARLITGVAGEAAGVMLDSEDEESEDWIACDKHLESVQIALGRFQSATGSYPRTLDGLVPQYVDKVTNCQEQPYGYNPIEGSAYMSNAGPAPEDYFTMIDIEEAINVFGSTTGYYPSTLDALYPDYITFLPRTAAHAEFVYDNKDGKVAHPLEGAQWD